MKSYQNQLLLILFFMWVSPAMASLGDWAQCLRNAVRSTLGFRLMKPKFAPCIAAAGTGLNYKLLQDELEKDKQANEQIAPLKAQFSCRLNGFFKCKKNDEHCLAVAGALKQISAYNKRPFASDLVTGTITEFEVKENGVDVNHTTHTVKFAAHGDIKCPRGNGLCNNSLYLASKCGTDFSQCVKNEFNGKPRTQKCASVFNLFGFDHALLPVIKQENNIDAFGIDDFDCTIDLDDEDSKSRWF